MLYHTTSASLLRMGRFGKMRSVLTACAKSRKQYGTAANRMKVTICGAAGNTGEPLSLLLKQSPLLDEIALFDVRPTCGIGMELGHVDTKCSVTAHCGLNMLCGALEDARVVVIVAGCGEDTFETNAPAVACLAAYICDACPNAITVVATEPLESLVPLVSEIQRARGAYDPRRLVGVSEHRCMRANSVLASYLRVPPETIDVKVIGGVTRNTMVPVFSQAVCPGALTQDQLECLTTSIVGCDGLETCAMTCSEGACLSGAYAVARTVVKVVKGLVGKGNAKLCAFVDTECQHYPGVHFLSNEVAFGSPGVVQTMGIPELSQFENCMLVRSVPFIQEEFMKAEHVVELMNEDPSRYPYMFPAACTEEQPCMDCGQSPCACARQVCADRCNCCGRTRCCCPDRQTMCPVCKKNPCQCGGGNRGRCRIGAEFKSCSASKVPVDRNLSQAAPAAAKAASQGAVCPKCQYHPCVCKDRACETKLQDPSCGIDFCKNPHCKLPTKREGPPPPISDVDVCKDSLIVRDEYKFYKLNQPVVACAGWDWDREPTEENAENPKKRCPYCRLRNVWKPRVTVERKLKMKPLGVCGCKQMPTKL